MASTIQLKTGTGSAVPSSLTQGEVGINIDNGLIYYGSGSGNDVKQLESFTHITASGDISASGNINLGPGANYIGGKRFITSDDGFEFRDGTVKALGGIIGKHITASKNISASGTIITNEITASSIHLLGDNKSITFDNATKLIGDHSIDGFQIRTQDATPIVFKTNGNNIRATIAADGEATFAGVLNSTKLNTGQGDNELYAMNQDVETTDGVQFATLRLTSTTDASATSTGHAFQAGLTSDMNVIIDVNEVMARNNGSTADLHLNPDGGAVSFNNSVSTKVRVENGHITASGNISSSGTVQGLTGSFSALVGDTSQGTSLEVEGPITGSAFRGTKHVLRCETIYINDNPLVQNSLYFGNTLGNQPNNWNDPQAAGGAITSTNTISIAEDDMNWGYILPFDISKVEVQCSLRPALGNGDDFTLAIYTADRQNDAASANMTITKVANSSGVTFSAAKYVTNDLTYTADLDKGSLIFVGVGSEDATDAKNARGLLNIIVTAR